MMQVIHIYPKDNSMIANYVNMLCKAVGNRIDMRTADQAKTLKDMCLAQEPDIIHVHGEAEVALPAHCRARLVITPHGQPLYHQSYYAVIARSKMEAQKLNTSRMEIVRNPIITKTTSFDKTADALLQIYKKVMDSDVLAFMDDDTKAALRTLLTAAVYRDRRWTDKMPANPDWRKLSIYAYYEQVDDYVSQGARILDITLPEPAVGQQTSYLPDSYKRIDEINHFEVLPILEKIRGGELTLRRLVELNIALLQDDLDEEKLLQVLAEKKYISVFSSLLQLLTEQVCLPEGFQPCAPTNNRDTQHLRTLLTNHLKL